MSYPVFVAILSPFILREKNSLISYIGVFLAFIGIYLLSFEKGISFSLKELSGILSGLTAGIAIIALRMARKEDSTETILFYTFGLGWLLLLPLGYPFSIKLEDIKYLFFSAFCGVLGQVFLTFGYKGVSALEGALISSSRIWIAAFSHILFWEEKFSLSLWIASFFIFIANILIAWEKRRSIFS